MYPYYPLPHHNLTSTMTLKRLLHLHPPCRSASTVPLPRTYASITDKYQSKLRERAQAYLNSKGRTDKREGIAGPKAIEDLRAKYQARVKSQVRITTPAASTAQTTNTEPIEKTSVKKQGQKGLDSYIDTEKLVLHSQQEQTLLWRARFANQSDVICAVINADLYSSLIATAKRNPMFVLPLFRGQEGMEMQFIQWSFQPDVAHLMMTSLLEYKMKGEYSRPHTVIAHHSELAERSGLVFMRGDLSDSRALEPLQASWMITLLQRFYCPLESDPTSARRTKILRDFNQGVDLDMDALIEEAKAVPGAGEV